MVLSLLQSPARCLARHQLCCSRTDRCRSHYQATSSHSTGAAEPSKPSRKRSQVGVTSAASALSSLTIQPLQRSSKTSEQPWSSGILCTGENCSYKADPRTVAWLKDLFNDLDSNGYGSACHLLPSTCCSQSVACIRACLGTGCSGAPCLQGWCYH